MCDPSGVELKSWRPDSSAVSRIRRKTEVPVYQTEAIGALSR
jgi:hypothetical protein